MADTVERLRKVAEPLQRSRHGRRSRERDVLVEALIPAHEEGPVALNGPAQHAAAIDEAVPGFRDLVAIVLCAVGVERVAAVEGERGAAERVRARLERHVDDAAARTAVGRVDARGLYLELLDGIHRRRVLPAARGRIRRAVEQEFVVAGSAPMD